LGLPLTLHSFLLTLLCRRPFKPNSVPLQALIIYLGRLSPGGSSSRLWDTNERVTLSYVGLCTRWSLPSHLCYQRCWWAFTPPFHYHQRGHPCGHPCGLPVFCCTCRRLTRPAVSWHHALWCSDFPRREASPVN
jgi:hypothetical protein